MPERDRAPLWVLVAIFSAATVGGEAAALSLGAGLYGLLVVPAVAGVALIYLATHRTPGPPPPAEEGFDDPVEEADRVESGLEAPPPPVAEVTVDGAEAAPPAALPPDRPP